MLKIKRRQPIEQPIEEIELKSGAPGSWRLIVWTPGVALAGLPRSVRVAEFQGAQRNPAVYDMTADEVDEFTTALRELARLD